MIKFQKTPDFGQGSSVMKNKGPDYLSIFTTSVFGIILLIFGFIGFYNGGSLISLLSGGIFGLAFLGCSIGMKKNLKLCTFGALILTTILIALFFFRALASHKIIPTVFGSLSLCVFLILFFRRATR